MITGVRLGQILAVLPLALIASSCSIDYGKSDAAPTDEVPLMTFHDLNQTGVKNGKIQYTMTAKRSDVFDKKKVTQLKQFLFQEYDSSGKPASSGSAEDAVVDGITNDAQLSGRLQANDAELGVQLTIDSGTSGGLSWANADRLLTTPMDATILLTKKDGSTMQARRLVLDLWANHLNLEGGVSGSWTPQSDDANLSVPAPASLDHPPSQRR